MYMMTEGRVIPPSADSYSLLPNGFCFHNFKVNIADGEEKTVHRWKFQKENDWQEKA